MKGLKRPAITQDTPSQLLPKRRRLNPHAAPWYPATSSIGATQPASSLSSDRPAERVQVLGTAASPSSVHDDEAAVLHAAAAICGGRLPAPKALKPTIAVLVRGLHSRSPATVIGAAEALLALGGYNAYPIFLAPGALAALQAGLRVEAAAPAVARVVQMVAHTTGMTATQNAAQAEDMAKAVVAALVRFDGAAGAAMLSALRTMAAACPGQVAPQLVQTEGALARLVRALSVPATAEDAAAVFCSLVHRDRADRSVLAQAVASTGAGTEGVGAALTAALSNQKARQHAAATLNHMAAAIPGLAARVVNVEGQVDALVAKGAALEPADCASLQQGALKALADHTHIDVAAHVAAALAPSLAAADPEVRDSVRSFLQGIEQLGTSSTAVRALELRAAAVQREVAPLSGRVAQLEPLLTSIRSALQPAVSSQQERPTLSPPAAAAPALEHAAAAIHGGTSPSPAGLRSTAALLVSGLHSRDPAVVTAAAQALARLCEKAQGNGVAVLRAEGALPALVAALKVESAAPAAAAVAGALAYTCRSADVPPVLETEGMMEALAAALVCFDGAVTPVLCALDACVSYEGVTAGLVDRVADTPGALARIVVALSDPRSACYAASLLMRIACDHRSLARRIADTAGALPALVAAVGRRSTSGDACLILKQIAGVGHDLAARILQTAGAIDALVAAARRPASHGRGSDDAHYALARIVACCFSVATARIVAALVPALVQEGQFWQRDARAFLKRVGFGKGAAVAELELAARVGAEQIAALRARAAELEVDATAATVELAAAVVWGRTS